MLDYNNIKKYMFFCIRGIFKIYKRKICKINVIAKNVTTHEYIITFTYVTKRQIFHKTAIEIYKNENLLNEFLPHEAALIGFYSAFSNYKK